jgi:uncharacterized protein (DUF2237 family)
MAVKKKSKKQRGVDQNDTTLPTCLGWCGKKRFKPKFPFDRYCTPCARKKDAIQAGLSKRERHAEVAGRSLPENFYD